MLNIFENYTQEAQDLHYSLVMSGYKHPTLILNENGFLPDSVTTPYAYFTGDDVPIDKPARYFNQIKVPGFWEIKSSNTNGEIWNHDKKMANIFYAEPSHKRLVRAVEWLDSNGTVRLVEHYNKHGRLYAQSNFNKSQVVVLKTYYDQEGKEKIVENFSTGDIILNINNKVRIFKTKLDFVLFFLNEKGFDLDTIIYNSLALPFQISLNSKSEGNDILFWQEKFQGHIPGNMQLILDNKMNRSSKVIIPNPEDYQEFMSLNKGLAHPKVTELGYLYPLNDEKTWNANALIFTNSDQIEHIEQIVNQSQDIQFHIAALTEMSPKLLQLGQKSNVKLYPNVSDTTIAKLWKKCCVYLDINHANEILSANRVAFEHRMPILTFKGISHNSRFTLEKNTFDTLRFNDFINHLNELSDNDLYKNEVLQQLAHANHSSKEDYQEVINHV